MDATLSRYGGIVHIYVVHELSKEMHLHRTNVLLILLYNTFVLSLSWGL